MALNANALTTLATLKAELSITDASEDTYLERQINVASAFIEAYCRRVFWYASGISESLAGRGGKFLALSRTPIVAVTSVSFDGTAIDSSNYSVHNAGAGLLYHEGSWIWTAARQESIGAERLLLTEEKLYTVVYSGGFVTPEQGGTVTLPADLEDACIALAVIRYRQKGSDPTIKQERLMEASVTYAATSATTGKDPLQAMAPHIWNILQRYRRHGEVL